MIQNVENYGGDKHRISLSGHSAGAHLGALALVRSALTSVKMTTNTEAVEGTCSETEMHLMVKSFIGLSGPYDIADQYIFESKRVVGPFDGNFFFSVEENHFRRSFY